MNNTFGKTHGRGYIASFLLPFMLVSLVSSCSKDAVDNRNNAAKPTHQAAQAPTIQLNLKAGRIGPLYLGASEDDLKRLQLPYTKTTQEPQGSYYQINLTREASLVGRINSSSHRIFHYESTHPSIRDSFNLGTGSTLQEVQAAYPAGNLMHCATEHGATTTYKTPKMLSFIFKHTDVSSSTLGCQPCTQACQINQTDQAQSISVKLSRSSDTAYIERPLPKGMELATLTELRMNIATEVPHKNLSNSPVNVRVQPLSTSDVITTLAHNEGGFYESCTKDFAWCKITFGGWAIPGWVQTTHLGGVAH